jgi:hypothetical protein
MNELEHVYSALGEPAKDGLHEQVPDELPVPPSPPSPFSAEALPLLELRGGYWRYSPLWCCSKGQAPLIGTPFIMYTKAGLVC